jgi:RNA polymerase-interacting CarD/CdnL/TRCF family regulator
MMTPADAAPSHELIAAVDIGSPQPHSGAPSRVITRVYGLTARDLLTRDIERPMNVGDQVVLRGYWIGTVTAIRDGVIVVDELDQKPGEARFEVPIDRAAEALRALVDRTEAERLIGVLGTKPQRLSTAERAVAYRRAYRRGDLAEQAALLAAMYTGTADVPENQYQERFEKAIYGELALVLGISRKALRARIRSAATGEATPRSLALADRRAEVAAIEIPAAKGLVPIGAFAVDTRIAAGEARADVVVEARLGVWFAYAKQRRDDDITALVAVHRDSVGELATLAKLAKPVGRAPIEGAHIAIFDEAIVDDQEIVEARWEASFEINDGRAAVVALGGDGVGHVLAAAGCYVRVDV